MAHRSRNTRDGSKAKEKENNEVNKNNRSGASARLRFQLDFYRKHRSGFQAIYALASIHR